MTTDLTPDPSEVANTNDDLNTEFAVALAELATAVLGSTEVGPEFDTLLATINWLRAAENYPKARLLIGDLTHGY